MAQRKVVMAKDLKEKEDSMLATRARLKVEWREAQLEERKGVLTKHNEECTFKQEAMLLKLAQAERGEMGDDEKIAHLQEEVAKSKEAVEEAKAVAKLEMAEMKELLDNQRTHALEETTENLEEELKETVALRVMEKEQAMLKERKRMIDEKEAAIAADAADDAADDQKIARLEAELAKIIAAAQKDRETKLAEQKLLMLEEREEVKAREERAAEEKMLKEREKIMQEIKTTMLAERRELIEGKNEEFAVEEAEKLAIVDDLEAQIRAFKATSKAPGKGKGPGKGPPGKGPPGKGPPGKGPPGKGPPGKGPPGKGPGK